MIGNALEWYDYALYAQFSTIISETFFSNSEYKELLTFAVFALGFVIRPMGAILFSIIGDKFGRKNALSLGVFSMALPTAGIGLLPGYDVIGLTAPIMLCVMRLLQGLSLGGEFSVCITYLIENAPNNKRGLIGSASFVSMCIGMIFGSATAYLMHSLIPPEILKAWAWRLPFVLGLGIGIVGFYIRRNLSESPIYVEAKTKGQMATAPIMETIKNNWRELLISMGIYITVTAPFYTLTVYVESFLHKTLGYPATQSTIVNTIGLFVMIIVMPIAAKITDHIGRKPVIAFSSLMLTLAIYPIFKAFGTGDFKLAILAQCGFAFILACYMGPIPTVLVEMFSTRARLTGVSLSYNISAAIFGGTAPMTAIILQQITGNKYAMSIYLAFLTAFSFWVIIEYFKESYQKSLY